MLILVLLVLTVGLTSLGVRLPYAAGLSSNSGKPKPRPRAVIQNQIKNCNALLKAFKDDPDVVPERILTVARPQPEAPVYLLCVQNHQYTFPVDSSSRAPPSV